MTHRARRAHIKMPRRRVRVGPRCPTHRLGVYARPKSCIADTHSLLVRIATTRQLANMATFGEPEISSLLM